MTTHRATELRCNGSHCDNALIWDGNAAHVRRHARRNCGWIVSAPGGQDFCSPACRAQPEDTDR